MVQSYVGEVRMFGGNFAPVGWQLCDGSLLSISTYTTLYNLIGTTYGGNGSTNFAVPDLRGRVPVSAGTGAGLSPYVVGQAYGVENVTITAATMPAHNHPLNATSAAAGSLAPSNSATLATSPSSSYLYAKQATPPIALAQLNANAVAPAGGNQSHTNVMPVLAVTYIISLFGLYPVFN